MNRKKPVKTERDKIFTTVSEIVDMNYADMQIAISKIMKAIAANGSFTLQFINMAFTEVKGTRELLDKNKVEEAKERLDRFAEEISEFRKRI
jgi:hypothetical protein